MSSKQGRVIKLEGLAAPDPVVESLLSNMRGIVQPTSQQEEENQLKELKAGARARRRAEARVHSIHPPRQARLLMGFLFASLTTPMDAICPSQLVDVRKGFMFAGRLDVVLIIQVISIVEGAAVTAAQLLKMKFCNGPYFSCH